MNNDYDDMIDAAGKFYNVDPKLIKTVFQLESSGNPDVGRGTSGEIGPFQMMPGTAKRLGVPNPQDMTQAVPAAAKLLREGLDNSKGNPMMALAYYNSGRTSGFPASTANYVNNGINMYAGMTVGGKSKPQKVSDPYEDIGNKELESLSSPTSDNQAQPKQSNSYEDIGNKELESLSSQSQPAQVAPTAQPVQPSPTAASALQDQSNLNRVPTVDPTGNPLAQRIRNALSEQPNDYHFQGLGAVLPIAHDEATGENRLAIPQAIKNLGTGLLDLAEGPATGTVTPEGTAALASMMMGGLNASPLSKAVKNIPLSAADQAAKDTAKTTFDNSITTPEFRANPNNVAINNPLTGKPGPIDAKGGVYAVQPPLVKTGPSSPNFNMYAIKLPDKGLPSDITDPVNQKLMDRLEGVVRDAMSKSNTAASSFTSAIGGAHVGAVLGGMVGVPPTISAAVGAVASPLLGKMLSKVPGNLRSALIKGVIQRIAKDSLKPATTEGGYLNPNMQQPNPLAGQPNQQPNQ